MKQIRFTVIKNAISNVVRGGASAVVALALPHFLTRSLDVDRFAAWALMLQIAAYASYLDFGLQTAIARFLAQAMELEQYERRNQLFHTALVLLSVAGVLAMLVICVVLWQVPHLFHGIPLGLQPEFRHATLLLAAAACLSLPLSTFTGVLIGLHKNEYPALAIGSSRLIGAAAAIVAVHYTQSLVVLAICIGGMNVVGGSAQILIVRKVIPGMRIILTGFQRKMAGELLKYCLGLTVWAFSMFLVSGLDVTIVGHFEFSTVGYYAIASLLINFIAGLNSSVFSALMTPLAALHARDDLKMIVRIVVSSTSFNTYVNVLIAMSCVLAGYPLLKLWVGPAYAQRALPILIILAVAQAIRLVGMTYSISLVATGLQNHGIAQGLVEAITNLILSIVLAMRFGPIGVAWGTLIGAATGLLFIFIYTLKKTRNEIPIARRELFLRGVVGPVAVAVPFAAALFLKHVSADWIIALVGLVISIMLAKRAGYFSFGWRQAAV